MIRLAVMLWAMIALWVWPTHTGALCAAIAVLAASLFVSFRGKLK